MPPVAAPDDRAVAVAADALDELHARLRGCTRCPLSEGRTQVVVGSGPATARLMFVGEGPGANEDRTGVPFVGQAGKLLERLLGEIGLSRADVFIANVVKCRPPGNRDPAVEEIDACSPFLARQIELIGPRVIASLGNFATKLLSGSPLGITRVHGMPQTRTVAGRDFVLLPLFHPAAALYTPAMLATLREDVARIPALLEGPVRSAPRPVAAEPAIGPPATPAAPAPRLDDLGPAEQLGLF